MQRQHTIIVGAGIIGVSAAYELARRGHRVTLVDRADVASGASFGNAGIIAVGHPPLPRPGLIWKSIKWMLNPSSPLYIKPRLDPALIRWLWQFARACRADAFDRSMAVLTELGITAKACFDRLVTDERIDCEYRTLGWFEVFASAKGLAAGRHDAKLITAHGLSAHELGGAELRRVEPAFTDQALGAIHYLDSAFADPRRFVVELADRARRHGATLITGAAVDRIELRQRRFAAIHTADGRRIEGDVLVLAAGAWTTALAASIGVPVPMQSAKGYHLNLTMPTTPLHTAAVLADIAVAVTPMAGGLRLGGTVELSGLNHDLHQHRLNMLTRGAARFLHGVDSARSLSSWCGLRPCTADGLPVIGWSSKVGGLFVATGHAKMGFALGPATGRIVSDCVLDGKAFMDLKPMSPDRFLRRGSAPAPAADSPEPVSSPASRPMAQPAGRR